MGPIRGHRANVCLYRNWTATNHDYSPEISLFIPFIICSYAHKYENWRWGLNYADNRVQFACLAFDWHVSFPLFPISNFNKIAHTTCGMHSGIPLSLIAFCDMYNYNLRSWPACQKMGISWCGFYRSYFCLLIGDLFISGPNLIAVTCATAYLSHTHTSKNWRHTCWGVDPQSSHQLPAMTSLPPTTSATRVERKRERRWERTRPTTSNGHFTLNWPWP